MKGSVITLLLCFCLTRSLLLNSNSSLITVKEYNELKDLISEERQLRHILEHDVDTLRQEVSNSEAAYNNLLNEYGTLTKAYTKLKKENGDLTAKYSSFATANETVHNLLATSRSDIVDLEIKTSALSAFTAYGPSSTTATNPVVFSTVLYNIGNDYDSTTGKFTCQYPGLYLFTLNLYKASSSSYTNVYCYIQKDGSNKIYTHLDPYSSADAGYYEATNTIVMHLSRGQVVQVAGCGGYLYTLSSFTGFLVKAD